MNAAFLLYGFLLFLEGSLAWALTGQVFLLMAVGIGLLVYSQMPQGSRAAMEAVRLLTAGALAVAGPLQYQQALAPLLLCFIAVPHFLAATQALVEQRPDAADPSPPRSRALVFTIAFYSSMGLVLLLARGLAPAFSPAATASLALLVLLTALAAWEASRIPRLRPAAASPSRRPWLGPILGLVLFGLLYQALLPPAAQFLCRVSPHWKLESAALNDAPPQPRAPRSPSPSSPDEATRLGIDESARSGQHPLPARSNLQPTDAPRFLLKLEPADADALLAQGPIYLRSHTLNQFDNNQWSPHSSGGHWIDDASDGASDGQVTLPPPHPSLPLFSHEVFAFSADRAALPTLPGLASIQLPRIYSLPGDTFQSTATGQIRYRASSAPSLYQSLPNPSFLASASPDDPIHSRPATGELGLRLQPLAASIFPKASLLDDRLTALHAFFAKNCTYSSVMRNPHDLPPLENFLFDERRGHCDFYASAAALLLRQVGIPTRVAYGFASRERDPATSLIVLRDRHAHAWTEIFLQDYGWTLCDFTPAEHIAAPPPLPPPPLRTPSPPLPDSQSFAPAAPAALPPESIGTLPSLSFLSPFLNWAQQQQPWLATYLPFAPLALLGLALLFAARLWLRRPPPDPAAAAAAARAALDQAPPYFLEFLRLCAAAGHPKPEGRTPLEHHRALDRAGLPSALIHPLILYYCATRYEDSPRDSAREASLFLNLQSFAAALQPPEPKS